MSYVYIRSEPGLYTVGFYDPAGKWQPESDHTDTEAAARRVHFLNGGGDPELLAALKQIVADWESVDPDVQVPDEINTDEHWDAARAAIRKAAGE